MKEDIGVTLDSDSTECVEFSLQFKTTILGLWEHLKIVSFSLFSYSTVIEVSCATRYRGKEDEVERWLEKADIFSENLLEKFWHG